MLSRALGREVRLEGPARLALSLGPEVLVRDIRIANPPRFDSPDFARIGELRLGAGAPALAARRDAGTRAARSRCRRPARALERRARQLDLRRARDGHGGGARALQPSGAGSSSLRARKGADRIRRQGRHPPLRAHRAHRRGARGSAVTPLGARDGRQGAALHGRSDRRAAVGSRWSGALAVRVHAPLPRHGAECSAGPSAVRFTDRSRGWCSAPARKTRARSERLLGVRACRPFGAAAIAARARPGLRHRRAELDERCNRSHRRFRAISSLDASGARPKAQPAGWRFPSSTCAPFLHPHPVPRQWRWRRLPKPSAISSGPTSIRSGWRSSMPTYS